MNTYTHTQLLQALAKLLPEIEYKQHELYYKYGNMRMIGDTELLHLCWMVEETLNSEQLNDYVGYVMAGVHSIFTYEHLLHATWQQRTIALTKTLGVEIV